MSVNCLVCLDSGYLAISNKDPNIIVPMFEVSGSDLTDYRLQPCCCKNNKVKQWREEIKQQNQEEQLKI